MWRSRHSVAQGKKVTPFSERGKLTAIRSALFSTHPLTKALRTPSLCLGPISLLQSLGKLVIDYSTTKRDPFAISSEIISFYRVFSEITNEYRKGEKTTTPASSATVDQQFRHCLIVLPRDVQHNKFNFS